MKKIGNTIKQLREFKGLKRQYLADAIGVSLKTFSNFENNITSPSIEILEKTAEALGINILNFFYFTDNTVNENKIVHFSKSPEGGDDRVIKVERELYEKVIAEKERYIQGLEKQILILTQR